MAEQHSKNVKMQALDPILYPPSVDLLHKESQFVEYFYQVITQSVRPPFAISIDGLWGTGKTTVMRLLEQKLYEGGYSTFWFNPWEYRNTENIVLAFLKSLAAQHTDLVDELSDSGMKIIKVLLKSGMRAALNIFTMKSVSLKDIEADLTETEKEQMASYQGFSDSIQTLKQEFHALINAIGQKYTQHTVVIFFDDLDRCLPEDAIQLLEALKNLFVTPSCNCIFICGIDIRVAKNFIRKHYEDIEDNFAINYFRKIFNLTISMPANPTTLPSLLQEYIQNLLGSSDDVTQKLAKMIANCGRQADMSSVRKFLNVVNNLYLFQQFNPEYELNVNNDLIVYLLVLKEAWQPLYEELVQEAMKNPAYTIKPLVNKLTKTDEQQQYIQDFLLHSFSDELLYSKLLEYPTLA